MGVLFLLTLCFTLVMSLYIPQPIYETGEDWSVVQKQYRDELSFHAESFAKYCANATDAVSNYADPTVAEFVGVISSYFARGSDRRTFHQDMDDAAFLQCLEWQHFGRLVSWVELPAYLHVAREGLLRAMGQFERFRLQKRFEKPFTRDLGFINLGQQGEMVRFLQIKWVNEYVGSRLQVSSDDDRRLRRVYQQVQLRLENHTTPGQIKTMQAKAVERYARAKLRLEYDLAAEFFSTTSNLTDAIAPLVNNVLESTLETLVEISLSSTSSTALRKSSSKRSTPSVSELRDRVSRMFAVVNLTFIAPLTLDRVTNGLAEALSQSPDVDVSRILLHLERIDRLRHQLVQDVGRMEQQPWHAYRDPSPVSYLATSVPVSDVDLLVWLDSTEFHVGGHVGLWRFLNYSASQIDLIGKRVAVGINDHVVQVLRSSVSAQQWLGGPSRGYIDLFEFWRWSWTYAAARDLVSLNASSSSSRWIVDSAPQSNLILSAIAAAVGTALFALLQAARFCATKPWVRHTVAEDDGERAYQRIEWATVWLRALPYDALLNFLVLFVTAVFFLSLNLSFVHPVALVLYVLTFWYLATVIVDVYVLKLLLYLFSLAFYHALPQHLKAPVSPDAIDATNGMLLLNPLRPASDDQLRAVIRKNIDMLAGTSGTKHVVSILILQAVGNSLKTFRRYERILRQEIFNNDNIPADVQDRFFVFQMGGIAKPHNMFKVLRFLHQQEEEKDKVTADFIFGLKCQDSLSRGVIVDNVVRIGGTTCFRGVEGQGADAGVLATVMGAKLLHKLRNNGQPELANMLILDSDNSVDPVLILQMCATMTDRFMVWQPSINFYNANQSIFAFMKQYSNTHLGAMSNVGTTLVMGGVRSFGKYFARLRMYYWEEVERPSVRSLGSHFSGWWSLSRVALLLLTCVILLIPFVPWWIPVASSAAVVALIAVLTVVTWRYHVGEERPPLSNRYQEMFPLDRGFIQSEDSRHGGPFGRAAFVSEGCIHESTPPSFMDELDRENCKWMPTFDMRDFILLHTPVLWIAAHPIVTTILGAILVAAFTAGIILTVVFNFIDVGLLLVLSAGFLASGAVLLTAVALRKATTPKGYTLLNESRFPDVPVRAEYAESLVVRGLFSEIVWGCQVLVALIGLLVPGVLEMAYPLQGEVVFLVIVLSIVQAKFTSSFVTRLHRLVHPLWRGTWAQVGGTGVKTYRVARDSRWVALLQLLFVWPLHDVPIGLFEFAASTCIFLLKLVHKPFQVIWAMIGVILELRGLLSMQKVSGTWPSFVESETSVPYLRYVSEFHVVMSVGVGLALLTFGSPHEGLYNGPVSPLFRATAVAIIACIMAVLLGLIPFLTSLHALYKTRSSKMTFLRWKLVIGCLSSLFCCGGLLAIGFLMYLWQGAIPGVFLVRAFPILISSFCLGPGVAWLSGQILCVADQDNPTFMIGRLRYLAPIVVIGGGYIICGLAVFFTYPFAYEVFPVQNLATWVPTGDGTATVVVPFQVSLHNLLQVPWYFVSIFSVVVYCSVILGAVSTAAGVISIAVEAVLLLIKSRQKKNTDEVEEVEPRDTSQGLPIVIVEGADAQLLGDLPEDDQLRDVWYDNINIPSMIAVDHGRRPQLPLFLDSSRSRRESVNSPRDLPPLRASINSIRRMSALYDILIREGLDQTEPDAVGRVIDVASVYTTDDEESTQDGTPRRRKPSVTPRLPRTSRLRSAPAVMIPSSIGRSNSVLATDILAQLRGHGAGASQQNLMRRFAKNTRTLEFPLSALPIRPNEVIDASPASVKEIFSTGSRRKFSLQPQLATQRAPAVPVEMMQDERKPDDKGKDEQEVVDL